LPSPLPQHNRRRQLRSEIKASRLPTSPLFVPYICRLSPLHLPSSCSWALLPRCYSLYFRVPLEFFLLHPASFLFSSASLRPAVPCSEWLSRMGRSLRPSPTPFVRVSRACLLPGFQDLLVARSVDRRSARRAPDITAARLGRASLFDEIFRRPRPYPSSLRPVAPMFGDTHVRRRGRSLNRVRPVVTGLTKRRS